MSQQERFALRLWKPAVSALVLLGTVAAVCSLARLSFRDTAGTAPIPSAHSGAPATNPHPRLTTRRGRRRRRLEVDSSNDAGGPPDFSAYSCGDILTRTSPDDAAGRCAYARTCNEGDGLLLPFVFCDDANPADGPPARSRSMYRTCAILSPALVVWLVLLFRMLSSTAEDFFAPSPEMLSRRLGLPPRFAGASLLALGNGAPDISATVNAIISDPTDGYNLSLGALTGGGMFVGTVVAGSTIIAAGGVPCRGALVRDVVAYISGIVLVLLFLKNGRVGIWDIISFFAFYCLYAASVLAADIYHRTVVVPRAMKREEKKALERQAEIARERFDSSERDALLTTTEVASDATSTTWGDTSSESQPDISSSDRTERRANTGNRKRRRHSSSREEDEYGGSFAEQFLAALSNYAKMSTRFDQPVILHGPGGVLADSSHHRHRALGPEQRSDILSTMEEEVSAELGGECEKPDVALRLDHGSLWKENIWELRVHWEGFWYDTFLDESTNIVEKVLLALELIFTVARKLSVPVPCEGYYCRPVTAFSVALSPFWIGLYALYKFNTDLFSGGISVVGIMCFPSFSAGICIWLYADEKEMSIAAAGPVALYGFVMAATWIDFIGDQLVSLLEFLGVILHIPSPVMGLTVLAWGNSMGDLAADVALAKKGMANMAMTACFASPLFNMLIGLGGGFLALRSGEPGRVGTAVSLSPAVSTGFFFLLCNCIMVIICGRLIQNGKIPVEYGYFMFGIYICYVAASIVVQFMKVHH